MKKHIKWLLNEIDLWIGEGIITPDQGTALKARYPAPGESLAWGRIIFFSIGAVLIGLGVILLFAYNWQRLHRFAKLAVIFIALISAHGAGFRLRRSSGQYRTAGEGLHLLGTMLFGAGIWLIAQIYHINEHYPNAFLIWGIGALVMAWGLPSVVQGILATIVLVMWNSFEVFDFNNPHLLSPFLILGGIMPLAWIRRSRVLATVCTIGFLFTLFAAVAELEGDLAALIIFFSACMLIGVSLVTRRRSWFPGISPIFSFLGFFVYMLMIFILSFDHRGSSIWSVDFDQIQQSVIFFAFVLGVVSIWVLAMLPVDGKPQRLKEIFQKEYYGVLAAFILVLLSGVGLIELGGWLGMGIFNMLFLYQAIMMIASGCRDLNLKITATGCVLFAIITFARYTDLFVSLLARSMVFLIAGAALFSVGLYYSRTKRHNQREAL
ncbi:MAG: DUF2157 domain-containing protein [Deltaproteobacteria bacterium]|jgi:uncharacterized membrane protein|nr:DUF2157 domain-containing protein [Deltaproteobacteria bacterium]